MKKENSLNPILKSALVAIKKELRRWYGVISVDELVTNRELTLEIKAFEQMLAIRGV